MALYDYSVAHTPSAPVCEVYLGVGGGVPNFGPHLAIIDTGADISVIPLGYLRQVGAQQVGLDRARSIWGDARTVSVYAVSMRIEHLQLLALRVLADEQSDEIVLGRTVLNRLKLVLDGTAGLIEVIAAT
jgi:predicted aspartyl protease